jgi:hypothetical protein
MSVAGMQFSCVHCPDMQYACMHRAEMPLAVERLAAVKFIWHAWAAELIRIVFSKKKLPDFRAVFLFDRLS